MARITDTQRIIKFIDSQPGKKAIVGVIAKALGFPPGSTLGKVTKGCKEGLLFINANGMVTKKRAQRIDKKPPQTRKRSKPAQEQLELPQMNTFNNLLGDGQQASYPQDVVSGEAVV